MKVYVTPQFDAAWNDCGFSEFTRRGLEFALIDRPLTGAPSARWRGLLEVPRNDAVVVYGLSDALDELMLILVICDDLGSPSGSGETENQELRKWMKRAGIAASLKKLWDWASENL